MISSDKSITLRENSIHAVIITLLLFAGAWLRISHIGTPSLWVDEANTCFSAESVMKTGQPIMPTGKIYGRAPIYTYTVALSYRLFGVDLESARLAAAFYGLIAVLLTYAIARRLFNPDVALMTAFLMIFSHFEIGWSRVARMYTLLQCFSLTAVYTFIQGVARRKGASGHVLFTSGNVLWLSITGAVILIGYFGVHQLAIFILPAFLVYLIFRSIVHAFTQSGRQRYLNTDSILAAAGLTGGLVAWFFVPAIQAAADEFFQYTPAWATEGATAQSRRILYEFLISNLRFPLAALFGLGLIQTGLRREWDGLLPACLLLTPLALLSLIFTHRVPRYLFDVYPFFLMIAAYGFVNIVRSELDVLKRRSSPSGWRLLVLPVFLLMIMLTPWFRIGLKIQALEDGQTNMAVSFNEWKDAVQWTQTQRDSGDCVIASLPESVLYYGLPADFGLNFANYHFSQSIDFKNPDGEFIDIIVGRPYVKSVDHLKEIVNSYERGWILITVHHFKSPNYLSQDIRDYLESSFNAPHLTKNGTIYVFNWARSKGTGS